MPPGPRHSREDNVARIAIFPLLSGGAQSLSPSAVPFTSLSSLHVSNCRRDLQARKAMSTSGPLCAFFSAGGGLRLCQSSSTPRTGYGPRAGMEGSWPSWSGITQRRKVMGWTEGNVRQVSSFTSRAVECPLERNLRWRFENTSPPTVSMTKVGQLWLLC